MSLIVFILLRHLSISKVCHFNLYYWCINVCLPWSPVVSFCPSGWDRCRRPRLNVCACVFVWAKESRRQSDCSHAYPVHAFICVCVYISQSWHIWHACRLIYLLPSYHPSLHRPPGDAWEKPGWNLSPSWNADDHSGRVGSMRVLTVIIMQGSRRIMSHMTESCRSGMSTLAYWVQSVWMMKEI